MPSFCSFKSKTLTCEPEYIDKEGYYKAVFNWNIKEKSDVGSFFGSLGDQTTDNFVPQFFASIELGNAASPYISPCKLKRDFGFAFVNVKQGERKEIQLAKDLEIESEVSIGSCITQFNLTARMADASPLKQFIQLNSQTWMIKLIPHAQTEVGTHNIKLFALNSDGTLISQNLKIVVENHFYPMFIKS